MTATGSCHPSAVRRCRPRAAWSLCDNDVGAITIRYRGARALYGDGETAPGAPRRPGVARRPLPAGLVSAVRGSSVAADPLEPRRKHANLELVARRLRQCSSSVLLGRPPVDIVIAVKTGANGGRHRCRVCIATSACGRKYP